MGAAGTVITGSIIIEAKNKIWYLTKEILYLQKYNMLMITFKKTPQIVQN